MLESLPHPSPVPEREAQYADLQSRISGLLTGEGDWISALATIACELHHAFDAFHWTGFYRTTAPDLLRVGPYQGGHGCLEIPFGQGVCGHAASTKHTTVVPDVDSFPGHIACSSSTRSEIVVPVLSPSSGQVIAVLDVDSDYPAAFDEIDVRHLEKIVGLLAAQFPHGEIL